MDLLTQIRQSAPPLMLTPIAASKPGLFAPTLRRVNPVAWNYVLSKSASLLPFVSSGGTLLDVVYPNDAKTLRAFAPPLIHQDDTADQGVQSLNPAAQTFAASSGIPFREIYPTPPDLVRWAHSGGHGWQEINPAAKSYVQAINGKFASVYPNPPPWSSDTAGSKDTAQLYAKLVGRPFDGPTGVYTNWHHESGFSVGDFTRDIVNTCGAVAGAGLKGIDEATGAISGLIGKIPVVGSVLNAVIDYTFTYVVPLNLAEDIIKGKRIDQAILANLNRGMRDIHTLAPYYETIIALVPGVGPECSGAIAAGLAIASGESAEDVAIDAAAAAIPGGEIVKACYHAGVAVMNGKGDAASLTVDALGAMGSAVGIQVPPAAIQVISAGTQCAQAIANGKQPADAIMDAAISQLPPSMQATANLVKTGVKSAEAIASGKNIADVLLQYGPTMITGLAGDQIKNLSGALMTGMAMGQAQALQAIQDSGITNSLGKLASEGQQLALSNPIVQQARALNDEVAMYGYDVGAALTQHVVNRFQVEATRRLLNAKQQLGYDMALGLHIARVTSAPPAHIKTPAEIAGYSIAHGMRNAPTASKKAVLTIVVKNPAMAKGVKASAEKIAAAKASSGRTKWLGTGVGLALGVAAAGPLGALYAAGAAAGGLVGVGVDLARRRKINVSHGVAAKGAHK